MPLFFILDLGLLFLFGQPALQSPAPAVAANKPKEQIQKNYYRWLYEFISSAGFQSLTTAIEHDGRRKKIISDWNIYRTERKIAAQVFNGPEEEMRMYSFLDAKSKAVPTFLECCLGKLDESYAAEYIFHPRVFSEPARFASIWDARAANPPVSSRNNSLAEQVNFDFLSEIVKTTPFSAKELFTQLDRFLIRARCLGTRDVDNTDLRLLRNYLVHYQLEDKAIDAVKQETLPLRRARVLIPEKTRSKEGGYHGIDYDGDWNSFVRSQLAIYQKSPPLFFNNYYNHKLLYYDRRQTQSRPLSILMAFFVNIGPQMRRRAESDGYKNALARELAAYFIEDIMRFVGMANAVNLDIYLACYQPDRIGPEIFLNAAEEKSFLVNLEDPILTNIFKTLDDFFFLDTAGVEPEVVEPQSQEQVIAAAAEQFHQHMINEFVLRAQQGRSEIEYDSGQIILLTNQIDLSNTEWVQECFGQVGFRIRGQMSHVFTLEDSGVSWATARSTDREWNPRHEKFQPYAQARKGTDRSLRIDFLKTVIRETLQHATHI